MDKDAEQPKEVSEFPEETWITDDQWVDDINVRWRKVISELMNGANIYEAYARAYDIETSTPANYNIAAAAGSRLLKNVKFRRLWDKVLEEQGFNDHAADSKLLEHIKSADASVSLAALSLYSKLRGRVIEKIDHTTKGKAIQAPAIISEVKRRDAAAADTEATDGN